MKKTVVIIGVVALISLISAVVWLFASGKVIWAAGSSDISSSYGIVCNAAMVERYNEAVVYEPRSTEDDEILSPDLASLLAIKTEINDQSASANDPTCQSILLWVAVEENNYDQAQEAYDRLAGLHERNIFPNNNLLNNESLTVYRSTLEFLNTGTGLNEE